MASTKKPVSSATESRSTIAELQRQIDSFAKIKPDAEGLYRFANQTFTKAAWKQYQAPFISRLRDLKAAAKIRGEQTQIANKAERDREIAATVKLRNQLSQLVQDFSDEAEASLAVEGQRNLNAWVQLYQNKLDEANKRLDLLQSGAASIPQQVQFDVVSIEQGSSKSPTVPAGTQPSVPVTPAPGTTGALFVPQTEGDSNVPTVPSGAFTGSPGGNAPRPTPSKVPPNAKPGDFVGGADRTLDNGGAVVQGIYIPPGTFATSAGGAGVPPTATGGGGGGGAMAPSPETTPTVPADWETAAQEQYGGYYAIIKSVPEIAGLLQRAVSEEWSDAKFDYELKQTGWYKTTSASAREWDVNKQRDPASAQQQIDTRIATIREQALGLGVRLSDATISKLSEDSLRGGWTEQILQNAIGSEAIKSVSGVSQLRTGFVGQQLRQTASNYGVSLSDTTFNEWVNKIAVGQENAQSFQQYALNTAKALYPGISAQLDAGQTFQQITDPYRQTAARTLEINAETIDFTDPKWAKAVTFVTDRGEQRPMNYNEWGDYLRQTRSFGYEFTQDAQSRAFQVANDIANLFGKV